MLWEEKERPRIRAVQMDNLRGLIGIRRMDSVPNAQIRKLFGVKKSLKACSGGTAMWRGWRGIGLLRE